MPFFSLFIAQTLLQIFQALFLSFDNGAHSSQSGAFQLFAAVKRITIFHQPHIVFGNTVRTRKNNLSNSATINQAGTKSKKLMSLTCQSDSWQY